MGRFSKERREPKHTQREVARVLGVHPHTIANWLKAGKLKGLTLADFYEFTEGRKK